MSEQNNPTSENEDLLAEAAAAMKKIQGEAEETTQEVVEEVEAVAEEVVTQDEAVTESVTESVQASVQASVAQVVSGDDDDDDSVDYDDDDVPSAVDEDDDDLDEDDEEEAVAEDLEYEEVAVDGPSIYAPQEVRGRARRIGNDVRMEDINYKNVTLLVRFLDPRGRILSRRKTRVSAKVQRRVAREIKRARHLALLPYTAEHIRVTRKTRRSSRQRQ